MRRAAPALLVSCALLACGGEPAPGWTPGDSLLDALDVARVERAPATSLPGPLRRALAALGGGERHVLEPGDWGGGRRLPESVRIELRIQEDVRRFRAPDGRVPPRTIGTWVARHEGVEMARIDRPAKDGSEAEVATWRDESARLTLLWDAQDRLFAFCPERPGTIELERAGDPMDEVGRWERAPDGPPEARRERVVLRSVSRDACVLAAPGALSWALRLPPGAALRFAVGQVEHGYRLDETGGVRVAPRASDGVVFAVEVETAEGERTRVWSDARRPGQPWLPARADLSRWGGEAVGLRLVCEPGERPWFDYGLWAGLRLDGERTRPPARPHVVLIDVDTLRADRMSLYGYGRETTPRLDAWAAEQAVVFTDVVSTSSWTLPATASIVTGLAVQQHGVLSFPGQLDGAVPPVSLPLRAAGYETWGMSEGGFVVPTFGFDLGFDRFDFRRQKRRDVEDPGWDAVVELARGRSSERPLFVFLQTYLVHAPYRHDDRFVGDYDGPFAGQDVDYENVIMPYLRGELELDEATRAYVNALYDAGIARLDARLAELLARLGTVFGDQPYLVVITSDHGEEFFEHGKMNHGYSLYEEVLRVPLVVRFPHGEPGRVDAPVSVVDIVPTILEAADLPRPAVLTGHPLGGALPARRARPSQQLDDVEALHFDGFKLILGRSEFGDAALALLDEDGEVAGPPPGGAGPAAGDGERPVEVYALEPDPREQDDLAERDPERVARLRALLEAFVERHPPIERGEGAAAPDAALLEELRAMGYLGDG